MRDGVAAFYDPYASPFSIEGRLGLRYRRVVPRVSNVAIAVAIAATALVAFVAADVATFEAAPVVVHISEVRWTVGNLSLQNASGFAVKPGTDFPVKLVCEGFCVPFSGVTVNSPCAVVNATFAYPYYEYLNATIQAPSHAYSGPLVLDLSI
jgi:hypothetical protein